MNNVDKQLDYLLSRVERPGRYIGHEIFMRRKDWDRVSCRVCLVYPDTYEVGMPFIGFQILYHILNAKADCLAERSYAPWTDMEAEMRQQEIPLFSLENRRPLRNFDIVGVTLQYEMTYTNVLNVLDLSDIPLLSVQRGNDDPLVIAGGSCAFNPEPLADYVDVFVIGDGEEIFPEICDIVAELKGQGADRGTILQALSLPGRGVYVPLLYNPEKDGPVKAAKIPELRQNHYPQRPLIPLIEITQDRFALEIQRGCGAGCRFCHAGVIYLPVRERVVDDLIAQTEATLKNSGYEEMSLLSLSTSDYSALEELVKGITPLCRESHVSISFPSLRLDSFNVNVLEAAGGRRRSGLTFAPEAGTQRLRNVINKKISEKDLDNSVSLALEHGWRTLKFYFMVGLPTETDADLQGIVDLILGIRTQTGRYPNTRINVSLSSFIPKAHTPFQWEAQIPPEELARRIHFIRDRLRMKDISIHYRDPYFSVYESLFSRGNRDSGKILYAAWKRGARFDAWPERFNAEIWEKAIEETGTDICKAIAERPLNEALPWSFVHSGVNEDYLRREREKALQGEITEDCRELCTLCGVCNKDLQMLFAKEARSVSQPEAEKEGEISPQGPEYYTLRLYFEKKGMLRYIGHHDLMRLIYRVCNMLKWPLRYSSGYNKRPRIALGYPIPMGYDASCEAMDILLNETVENPMEALNSLFPEGLRILRTEMQRGKRASIMTITREMHYRFHFEEEPDAAEIRERIEAALAKDHIYVQRRKGKETRSLDLKPFIKYWQVNSNTMDVCYKVVNAQTGRPDEFLKLAFGDEIPFYIAERKHITIKE